MSVPKFSLILFFGVFYALYESYSLRVDPMDFATSHRRKMNADRKQLFDFLTLPHILEKWFPGRPSLKSADGRIPGVGKYFLVFYKFPLIGERSTYFITTDYKRGKIFAIQSNDSILNPRLELRTDDYYDQTILEVKISFEKPSALFHYTIGTILRFIVKFQFEETMIFVVRTYEATDTYGGLT